MDVRGLIGTGNHAVQASDLPVNDIENMDTFLMRQLPSAADAYRTRPETVFFPARVFPSLCFYLQFLGVVLKAGFKAKYGRYDDAQWVCSSCAVLEALEGVGIRFEMTGMEHIRNLREPCVLIANHMSVLETVILPCIIQPVMKTTFIVKESLLSYPVFGHVMRSRNPIAVGRRNPRLDLKMVLEGGTERLKEGISIIAFPQTTRTFSFDPAQFNTIGVKLARKAEAPVVPIALLTDAWQNGKHLKDFGRIDTSRTVHFAFGEPIRIRGRGDAEHRAIIDFIVANLKKWKTERQEDPHARAGIRQFPGFSNPRRNS